MRGIGRVIACYVLAINSVTAWLVLLGTIVFTIVFGFNCLVVKGLVKGGIHLT